jgi:hypothetical protein
MVNYPKHAKKLEIAQNQDRPHSNIVKFGGTRVFAPCKKCLLITRLNKTYFPTMCVLYPSFFIYSGMSVKFVNKPLGS